MPSLLLFGGGTVSVTGVSIVGGTAASTVQLEKRGGTVIEITGAGFDSSAVVSVLDTGTPVGTGYIFDPVFDVTATKLYVGMPAVDPGTYDLSVTVGSDTGVLVGALIYVLFSEENKLHEVRRNWGSNWEVGVRILSNPTTKLGAL